MRKTINENPVVQVVLVGFLAIVVVFIFMTRVLGGSEPAPTATTTPTAATAAPGAEGIAQPGAAPIGSGDPAAIAPRPTAPAAETGFTAGPGLPKDVVRAYESGDAVVLLISKKDGIEDKRLREDVEQLRGLENATVFSTDSRTVARYSRIAQGVDLDRVPALVVIKPRRLTGPGLPEASVTYGFRTPQSVAQAVRDALYKGRELPYHPG